MKGGRRQGAGRKKGYSAIEAEKAREIIATALAKSLEPIIARLVRQAKAGDIRAIRELFDRAYGRPAQADPLFEDSAKDRIRGVVISVRK